MWFGDFWFKTEDVLLPTERSLDVIQTVALYEQKQLLLDKGYLRLTNHRIIYGVDEVYSLNLDSILKVSFDPGSWTKSEKILIAVSPELTFRLSFRAGGCKEILSKLEAALSAKEWCYGVARKGYGIGIGGIQKKLQMQAQQTELNISSAFEDLSNLMSSAKEMVDLSQKLMLKSKDKGLTEDETAKFRSQLLSIGLQNSEAENGSNDSQLQQEIGRVLLPAVEASSGIISLTEAYCRVNRARGLKLLSPEDMLSAFEGMRHPVKLYKFSSGLRVVQLSSLDENSWMHKIVSLLEEAGALSAEQLATRLKTSAVLALERLLKIEANAQACRDETINGLFFYPNKFLTEAT